MSPPPGPPLASRWTRLRRPLGVALAALSAAAIAVLTLTPQAVGAYEPFGHWCLVCGNIGGSDVVANVLLFAPFGFGLALAGLSGRRAALVGLAFSTAIELLQFMVVPGRFSTLSDVVTNTTGTALAAALFTHHAAWLRPRPRLAARFAAGAAALFVGTLTFTAWALGVIDDADHTPARADAALLPTGMGWFTGHVTRVVVDGQTFEHRGTGPVTIAAPSRSHVRVEAAAEGFDDRETLIPLVYLHRTGEEESWMVVGQLGIQLVAVPSFNGRRLRLRRPNIGVRRIGGWRHHPEGPFTVVAEVASTRLTISVTQGDVHHTSTVRVSPTLGWALLSPIPRIDVPGAAVATVAWLAGLAVPLGYYARWLARGRGRLGGEVAVAAGVVAVVAAGLAAVPRAAGFSVARPWEWVAAFAGVLTGAAIAEVVRRARQAPGATSLTRPSTSS